MPLLLLLLLLLAPPAAVVRGNRLPGWQPANRPGIYLPSQFGVHSFDLTGPVALDDGTNRTLTAHVIYKAVKRENTLRLKARVFFSDSVEAQLLHLSPTHVFPYHNQPAYMKQIHTTPSFYLRPARYGEAAAPEQRVNLTLRELASPSHERMGEQPHDAARNVYLMYIHFWDAYVLPFHLDAGTELDGWATEAYMCVDGWYQCALLPLDSLAAPMLPNAPARAPHPAQPGAPPAEGSLRVAAHSPQIAERRRVAEQLGGRRALEEPHAAPAAASNEQQAGAEAWHVPAPAGAPRFVRVQHPYYEASPNVVGYLLHVHTLYHVELGFAGSLVYERGAYQRELEAMPGLQALMHTGRLAFMRWGPDEARLPMPLYEAGRFQHLVYDQILVYNHAALALSGTNTYIFFADTDDFLALPGGGTVHQVVGEGGCAEGAVYLQIPRWSHSCNTSMQALVEASGATMDSFAPGSWSELPLPHLSCGTRSVESLTGRYDHPKSIVLADAVGHFDIHFGFVLQEYLDRSREVDAACTSVRHLYNVQVQREWVWWWGGNYTQDVEWMWPLKRQEAA